jgi:flavin reductase (DIM6/NTAB) family NADH-FMN oxidoreductase RutF
MKKAIGPQTLLYPMPAVLVGAQVKGKPNFMTAAWCGIAASTPPAISRLKAFQRTTHFP